MEFDGCHSDVKNDGQTIDMSKFQHRMKRYVQKCMNDFQELSFKDRIQV